MSTKHPLHWAKIMLDTAQFLCNKTLTDQKPASLSERDIIEAIAVYLNLTQEYLKEAEEQKGTTTL